MFRIVNHTVVIPRPAPTIIARAISTNCLKKVREKKLKVGMSIKSRMLF